MATQPSAWLFLVLTVFALAAHACASRHLTAATGVSAVFIPGGPIFKGSVATLLATVQSTELFVGSIKLVICNGSTGKALDDLYRPQIQNLTSADQSESLWHTATAEFALPVQAVGSFLAQLSFKPSTIGLSGSQWTESFTVVDQQ